eukprot:9266416-Alexandrium_andersonii.AAC.1
MPLHTSCLCASHHFGIGGMPPTRIGQLRNNFGVTRGPWLRRNLAAERTGIVCECFRLPLRPGQATQGPRGKLG